MHFDRVAENQPRLSVCHRIIPKKNDLETETDNLWFPLRVNFVTDLGYIFAKRT